MDWLDTAYTLIKRFNDRTPGIAEGMATAIRTLAPRGTDAERKKLARIKWGREVEPYADWVAASANVNRLPDEVAGVWFSVPELDLNAPLIYFIGSRSFRDKEGHEWACDAYWAQARRRSRSKVQEGPDRARLRPPGRGGREAPRPQGRREGRCGD